MLVAINTGRSAIAVGVITVTVVMFADTMSEGVAVGCSTLPCGTVVAVTTSGRAGAASATAVAVGRKVTRVAAADGAATDNAASRIVSCGVWLSESVRALSANQSANGSGVASNQRW